MPLWYYLPYNTIYNVEVDDKTFSIHGCDNTLLSNDITLPKSALGAMIMHYEDILLDLEDNNKPAKKYWSDGESTIYTKQVFDLDIPKCTERIEKKVLCLSKPPVDVVLLPNMFKAIVLKATILNRIRGDDCKVSRVGPKYDLNSTKSMIFHDDDTFSVCDEIGPNQFQMQFDTITDLIMLKKGILADLNSQDLSEENEYVLENNGLTLKTRSEGNSRVFSLWLEGIVGGPDDSDDDDDNDQFCNDSIELEYVQEEIFLTKHTFDLMLHVALGAPMWKEGMEEDVKIKESRMLYWNSTPFNTIKKLEFSNDLQKFTITNESYGITLTMPTAALKALLDRKVQVLSDFDSETTTASRDKGFINEYWTDQTHAIRTGVLYNLFREIDCNVVRFVKVKDNECVFVAHKEAFLRILESYQNRRRNFKRR